MRNKNWKFAVGQLSLALSILLNHFFKDNEIVSFFVGLFTGLAIVLNVAYLISWRKLKESA